MDKNQKDLKKDDKHTAQTKVGQQKSSIIPIATHPNEDKNVGMKKDDKKNTTAGTN